MNDATNEFIRKHLRLIVIIAVAIPLIFIGWWIYYANFVFHITSVTPNPAALSSYSPRLVVEFNMDVSQDGMEVVSDDVSIETSVDGKKLIVNMYSEMTQGKVHVISIKSLRSTGGDEIRNQDIKLYPRDTFDTLSDSDRDIILERQDQKDELYDDPIYSFVPHSTLYYSIDPIPDLDDEGFNIVKLRITVPLTVADINIGRDDAIETARQMAMAYLEGLEGIDLTSYPIELNVIDPTL